MTESTGPANHTADTLNAGTRHAFGGVRTSGGVRMMGRKIANMLLVLALLVPAVS